MSVSVLIPRILVPPALLALFAAHPTIAATLHVPGEYATINAALDASAFGDTVLVAPGTYSDYETRQLQGGGPFAASSVAFLKAGVSLIGEGGQEVTRIDLAGQGVGSAVPVLAYGLGPGTVVVQGFTITGAPVGNSGMWARFMDRMVIRNCRFEDLDGGPTTNGGLYSETTDLELTNTEFLRCRSTATGRASGVEHVEGDVFLEGCRFEGCEGRMALALAALGLSPPFDASILSCVFVGNRAGAGGAGEFMNLTVEDCTFVGNHNPGDDYVFTVLGGSGGIDPGPYILRRNVFVGNTPRGVLWDRVRGTIEENTFVDSGEQALGLSLRDGDAVTLRRNIVAHTAGRGIRALLFGAPLPVLECNAFWDNSGGDLDGLSPGPTDLFVDPLFCDRAGGDYTLARNSPCLPPQSGACGQIGALGEGCAEISVEPHSWAKTKALFRTKPGRREER